METTLGTFHNGYSISPRLFRAHRTSYWLCTMRIWWDFWSRSVSPSWLQPQGVFQTSLFSGSSNSSISPLSVPAISGFCSRKRSFGCDSLDLPDSPDSVMEACPVALFPPWV